MRRVLICGIAISAFLGGIQAALAAAPPTFAEVITHCESCHGPKGNSSTPSIPRLNGQSDFLLMRLKGFGALTSPSAHAFDNMWLVVTAMNDDEKNRVAKYFSRQLPPSVTLSGPPLGKSLYEKGLPAKISSRVQVVTVPTPKGGAARPVLPVSSASISRRSSGLSTTFTVCTLR